MCADQSAFIAEAGSSSSSKYTSSYMYVITLTNMGGGESECV
jgi:uncharacterized protein Veg